jgi:hypothetical protein
MLLSLACVAPGLERKRHQTALGRDPLAIWAPQGCFLSGYHGAFDPLAGPPESQAALPIPLANFGVRGRAPHESRSVALPSPVAKFKRPEVHRCPQRSWGDPQATKPAGSLSLSSQAPHDYPGRIA